jgi:diguanylate cyclase (GGDEF)-like protein/PAS domain S-box-containing protein
MLTDFVRVDASGAFSGFDLLGDSVMATDSEGRIVYINASLEQRSGYLSHELVGETIWKLLAEASSADFADTWSTLQAGAGCHSLVELRSKAGVSYCEDVSISVIRSSTGEVANFVWIGRTADRDESQSFLRRLAELTDQVNRDSLTGVMNREHFQAAVERIISRDEHGAVLFMDVDDFKSINDSLGHSAGDEVLRGLAKCLSDALRREDLLARLGGDEFAILLRGASRSQAAAVARRLLDSVRGMKVISFDHPISTTISIGGALFPLHGSTVDELLGHADMAMYRAKRGGRNSFHFYQTRLGSKSSSASRVRWKQRILEALEQDRFCLYAQPIFELSTGRLGCYELLIRMRDADGKLILPNRFLPAAEQSGLIHQIDAWVLHQGLAIAKRLADSPQPVKVAMNVSAAAVGNAGLLDLIKRETSQIRMEAGFVTIEITETALIGDIQKARTFFRSLRDLGFRISLDDFGAGFSSFTRLKSVPADYLKIDGSFIRNITRNERDRHFVKAIADLASGLGIGAVAEWVEDADSIAMLVSLGVLNGQGNYLGPPVPVSRILPSRLPSAAA